EEEIQKSGVNFSYDDHGHPELGKVSKAHIFCEMIENKISALKLKVKIRPVEIGYEVRCDVPIAYDRQYCSLLGFGVYDLFKAGHTGCMVYVNNFGDVAPLFLRDLQDSKTGKIPPRLVDIDGQFVQSIIKYVLHFVTPDDYEAVKKYVANPAEYDFLKILNW
ncbi:MAG: 6-phosphofructokinase, partial [Prevotellaceae bacterium]|nr:6-phosphofructokinase [Prevotellaceae bacterium]